MTLCSELSSSGGLKGGSAGSREKSGYDQKQQQRCVLALCTQAKRLFTSTLCSPLDRNTVNARQCRNKLNWHSIFFAAFLCSSLSQRFPWGWFPDPCDGWWQRHGALLTDAPCWLLIAHTFKTEVELNSALPKNGVKESAAVLKDKSLDGDFFFLCFSAGQEVMQVWRGASGWIHRDLSCGAERPEAPLAGK